MGRAEDFIKKEQDDLGSLLYKVNGAIAEIAPFIEEETLKNRKYYSRLDTLKEYTRFLDVMMGKEKKDGIFGFLNDSRRITEIEKEKRKYILHIKQIEKCTECKCLNCIKTCKFDGCEGCREKAFVRECDKEAYNTVFHKDFILDLDKDGRSSRYNVLATMQNIEINQRYIIIQDINSGEKFILHYYPGISNSDYGEITNPDEFDFVVKNFERLR